MRDSFVLLVIALFLIYLGASRRGKLIYLVITGQEDKIVAMTGSGGNYSSATGLGGGLSGGGGKGGGGSGGNAG